MWLVSPPLWVASGTARRKTRVAWTPGSPASRHNSARLATSACSASAACWGKFLARGGPSRNHRGRPPISPPPARTARPPASSRAIPPRRRQPPRRAPPGGNASSSPGLATTAVGCPRRPTPAIGRWTGVFQTAETPPRGRAAPRRPPGPPSRGAPGGRLPPFGRGHSKSRAFATAFCNRSVCRDTGAR
jgi:hypothetical protein